MSSFCAYHTLAASSGICTDCSKFDRQALCIWVLLPQISGIFMNLYLLTFKFLVSWKSEVKPIYKRLYFFWGGKKKFLNLRILALPQGVLIKLSQKPNYRHLAVEFWTPNFFKRQKRHPVFEQKAHHEFLQSYREDNVPDFPLLWW